MRKLFGLFGLILVSCMDCATVQPKSVDLTQCTVEPASTAASSLVPTVGVILLAGKNNWRRQLEALKEQFGPVPTVCAVQEAVDRFRKTDLSREEKVVEELLPAIARGMNYLAQYSALI